MRWKPSSKISDREVAATMGGGGRYDLFIRERNPTFKSAGKSHPRRSPTEKLLPQWGEGEGTICSSGKEIQPLSPPVNLSINVIDVLPLKWYRGSAFNNHLRLWGCPFQIACTLSIGQMWPSNNGRNLPNELCVNGIHLTSQLVSPLVWWPQHPCQHCRTLRFIHYANSPYAVSCCLYLSAPFSPIPVDLQARRIIVPFFSTQAPAWACG